MASVKGLALVACGNYLKEKFGESDLKRLLADTGPARYEMLMDPLVGSMYPLDDFIEINKSIDKVLGKGDFSILREIGRFSADEANRGIYKIFFRIGSPQFIIKKAAVIFSKYYDTGHLSVKDSGANFADVVLTDFDYKDRSRFVCTRVEGWIERTLEIVSTRKVTTRQEKCIARGDSICDFVSKW